MQHESNDQPTPRTDPCGWCGKEKGECECIPTEKLADLWMGRKEPAD